MKKMKIKLLHLYYDILNIYGENGNMRALVKALEYQGLKVNVDFKTIDDEINFNDYDFIYVGSGLDESIDITFEDLKKYRSDLEKYINDNKFILATGNSLELFIKLGILNYQTNRIDFRIVGDQVFITNLINERIIGFQNRECIITNNKENSIFEVIKGCGYEPNNIKEGIRKNNFYGTFLLGPILIRNPYLLEYFVKEILKSKNLKYKKMKHDVSFKAYEEFLKNFVD